MEDEDVPLEREKKDKSPVAPTIKIQTSKYTRHSGKKEELRRLKRLQK